MKKSFYLLGLLVACFMLLSTTGRAAAPVISSNPNNDTVCSGTPAWFVVLASDTSHPPTTITYQWLVSTNSGSSWSLVDTGGAYPYHTTHDSLRVASRDVLNGYWFKCITTDGTGSDTSTAALLVVDTAFAATITGPSAVCQYGTITLSDTASGGTWSESNSAIDTIGRSSGIVTGLAMGTNTITYTVGMGACIARATYMIRVDTTVTSLPITGPNATCVGNVINLSDANVIGTGTWSASNASASVNDEGMLEGISGGIDTITYSFTNACNSIDTFISIHVDTALAHGTITGPTDVCVSSWITLSDAVAGGIWISSDADIAVTDMAGNITGISQGDVVISYLLSNACGISIATDNITVSIAVTEITGNDSVGVGNTRALFDTTVGGTWTSGNTTHATVNSSAGIVTGVAAGSAIITYTVINPCGTSYATFTMYVGVPNAGAISGADSVCENHTITLSDTKAGGVWTSSNDTVATVNSDGKVTGLSYGSAEISYILTNGFGSDTVKASVFVHTVPVDSIVVPGIFAEGGGYPVSGFTKNGNKWVSTWGTWTSSNDSVAYVKGNNLIVVCCSYGTDTITYSAHNTCGTTDTSFVITVANPNSVIQLANTPSVLNVYPNPSDGDFIINLLSGTDEQAVVTITNIVGVTVKEFSIATNHPASLKLDQPDGIYFITTTSSTGKNSAKITITK